MASAMLRYCMVMFVIIGTANVAADANGPVSPQCMGCLCKASTGCDLPTKCERNQCGLFQISRSFWIDAGKPVLSGQSPDQPGAYQSCALDPYCSDLVIQEYMTKFGNVDCNDDGQIDCYDFVAIKKLGPYGCKGDLAPKFLNVFEQCMGWMA